MSSSQQVRNKRRRAQSQVAGKRRSIASLQTDFGMRSKWKILVICVVLTLVTSAVYIPIASNPFINLDDPPYVFENPHVQGGLSWQTLTWAMTTADENNWHPLTWLSHALDCQLYGLNAGAHHVSSLLIHIFNVLLLFLLLVRGTGAVVRSALVAALFALHPLNVESVAWIAERKNVLSMFFFLLALGVYGWYVRRLTWRRYALLALLFAMGLASKPMIITLPCVLFLLDYWPLGRIKNWTQPSSTVAVTQLPWPRLVIEKLPLLLLSAGSAVVTVIVQRASGFVNQAQAANDLGSLPLHLRLENAVYSYGMYLAKTFWPTSLAVLYPHPLNTLTIGQIAASLVLLVMVSVFVWKQRTKHEYLLTGWLWFLGTLLPVIGIIQVGSQGMADRYAYLPTIGIFLILIWGCADLIEARALNSRAAMAIAIAGLAWLSFLTHRQIGYWKTSYDLWTHTLKTTQNNFFADGIMGYLFLVEGRPGAAAYFEAMAKLAPTARLCAYAHTFVSFIYNELGNDAQSQEHLRLAISLDSREVNRTLRGLSKRVAQSPDAVVVWRFGLLLEGANEIADAKAKFERALQLDPQFSPARKALEGLSTSSH